MFRCPDVQVGRGAPAAGMRPWNAVALAGQTDPKGTWLGRVSFPGCVWTLLHVSQGIAFDDLLDLQGFLQQGLSFLDFSG